MTEEPVNDAEKIVEAEKQAGQDDAGDTIKDSTAAEAEEKEPEEKVTVILWGRPLFVLLAYLP